MHAYTPEAWHDLFVAVAGSAAALTGLIFVAVSINLRQILDNRVLPVRAAETLTILVGILLLSVFMLVPGQSNAVLGTEIAVLGAVILVLLLPSRLRLPRQQDDPKIWTIAPIGVILAGTVPMIIAGVSLGLEGGGGLYWLIAELILGITGVALSAWILLVEIAR
ncbi:MAG TPA: hypothetical protein VH641_18825 [Streptosporangiaceae bacterium]